MIDSRIFTYQFCNLILILAACHVLVFSAELWGLTTSLFYDKASKCGLVTNANIFNNKGRRNHCHSLDIIYNTKWKMSFNNYYFSTVSCELLQTIGKAIQSYGGSESVSFLCSCGCLHLQKCESCFASDPVHFQVLIPESCNFSALSM